MRTRSRIAVTLLALTISLTASAQAEIAEGVAEPRTEKQQKILEVVKRWEHNYNEDVEKMVTESYAPDARVAFTGASVKGKAQFLKLEKAIKGAAPGRKMRIDRILFAGDDVAIVEAVILDTARPDFYSPWCAILTIKDGKIVEDHTYLDPARWPGIDAAKDIPTPGGLGAPKTAAK